MTRLRRDVPWGLGYGLFGATLLTAWVSFLALLNGSVHFPELDTTLGRVIAGYYLAGTVAGATVGVFRPALRARIGAFVVGWLAGTTIYSAVAFVQGQLFGLPFWVWFLPGLGMGGLAVVTYDEEHPAPALKRRWGFPVFVGVSVVAIILMLIAGWW